MQSNRRSFLLTLIITIYEVRKILNGVGKEEKKKIKNKKANQNMLLTEEVVRRCS